MIIYARLTTYIHIISASQTNSLVTIRDIYVVTKSFLATKSFLCATNRLIKFPSKFSLLLARTRCVCVGGYDIHLCSAALFYIFLAYIYHSGKCTVHTKYKMRQILLHTLTHL